MRSLALFAVVAALIAFNPIAVSADVIDDEPTPGLEPARRPAPAPPPPPPPARKPAPPPPPPAPAAKPAPAPAPAPMAAADLWRFELAAYLWMHSLDGDAALQGVPIDVDATLKDTFSDFSSKTYAGRAEAWRDRFGVFVESGLTDVDESNIARVGAFDIDYDLERIFVDFGISYQALKHEMEPGRYLTLEPYVGGRWARIKQRASAGLGPPFRASQRDDYWEPFVGGRVVADLTERLQFRVGGDAGGFGAGSELTWNALGELGIKVTGPLSLRLGYAAQGIDYEARGGGHKLDTIAHGPRFGFALNF